ncbi:ROK family protein [Cohnella sp. WQ 127256]|uniref:ROK family protein n=1 Tax=Cohnella sp. WQ 127256 TaxID=2938790 RepID=UPI0021179708|nr:ROK family protein [Cohnella sp. WQ 127256]
MENQYLLAFDVGGTYIKAGIIHIDGLVLEHTLTQYEAYSNGSVDEITEHFKAMARDLASALIEVSGARIYGIGYAFPGPFDYERGISYIQGLNKFEAIYGMNIGEKLRTVFQEDSVIAASLAPNWRLAFENDASLFALGEAVYGQASTSDRVVCMTIGTGLGSGFVDNRRLVKQRQDVPENGWLYHLPYRDGIADNFVSRRGVLSLAAQLGFDLSDGQDVRELAQLALSGDELAVQLFEQFGERMAQVLAETMQRFQPDAIVIGGQIAKSGELFVPALIRGLHPYGITTNVKRSENTLLSTFRGIYHFMKTDT